MRARALQTIGILSEIEARDTIKALDAIAKELQDDPSFLDGSTAEDVHHFVESALVHELGALGWKLHTGRSRNELVATDFRLFLMDAAAGSCSNRVNCCSNCRTAKTNSGIPMAGMTHMARAADSALAFLAARGSIPFVITRLQHAAKGRRSPDGFAIPPGIVSASIMKIERDLITRITANSLDNSRAGSRRARLPFRAHLRRHASIAPRGRLPASQEFAYAILPDEYANRAAFLRCRKENPDALEPYSRQNWLNHLFPVALLTT